MMDEAAIQRVVNFSTYLKTSADILLDKCGVVSLDTWTLFEIEEAFSLIFEVEKYTNFHVLPPNNRQHPAIPHIQFLYDILQKVKKLRILTKPYQILPLEQQINLKCFRNLYSLELDFIPVHQLKGLQNLRPILKFLTVRGVCSQISEILLKCGADKSTEYMWENLQLANFSRNHLASIDSSLRLLPAIKILDLSHCQLIEASALFCLPTISTLDLSYNKLTCVPPLSENASNSLVSFNLSNNMIVDLKGIERFSNLEELNLKENFLSIEQTLAHLSDLPHLGYLNLLRNPITCGLNYRIHVLRCLNPATKFCEEFLFDDSPILFSERKEIGTTTEPVHSGSSSSKLIKFLTEKVSNLLRTRTVDGQCVSSSVSSTPNFESALSPSVTEAEIGLSRSCTYKSTSKVSEKKKSRKNQTRHVSITDPGNSFPYSSINVGNTITSKTTLSSSTPNVEPSDTTSLIIDDSNLQLTETRSHLQTDSDLSTFTTAPSQSDKLLEEILSSHSSMVRSDDSTDQTITNHDDSVNHDVSVVSSSSSSFCRMNESCSRQLSQDFSPINTDDDDLEPNRELYSVVAKWEHKLNDKNVEVDSDLVFLSFTEYFYKEKNGLSGGTMVKLNVSSLQSMEVLTVNPYKVQLNFNHTHPDLCSRVFILEEEDFKLLKELIEPIIERNHREEDLKLPLPCKECDLPFYGTMAQFSGTKEKNKYCKLCGNKKKPQPDSNAELGSKVTVTINGTAGTKLFSVSSDSFEFKPNISNSSRERKHKRQRSSAQSSDSSESVSVCSSEVSTGNLRRGSDLDLISNPSMSSIEVLSENHGTNGEERNVDDRWGFEAPVSAASNTDARTPSRIFEADDRVNEDLKGTATSHVKEPTLMQESSSSGSMTGSVCTAVDRLSSGPSTPQKAKEENAKERISSVSREHSDVANTFSTSNNTVDSVHTDDSHYLSTSDKSTDTVCHQPMTSLREAFATVSEYDSDKKGIIFEDPSKNVSLKPWIKNLLQCYTSYSWEWWEEVSESGCEGLEKESNPFVFIFDDFSIVDHRLKLFCEVFLFNEQQETLQGLVKAVTTVDSGEPFSSLLVISNRKIYILRIKGQEKNAPQEWLDVETCCFLDEVPIIYTLFQKQGIVLLLKEKLVLICLADPQRTNAILYFIIECFERFGVHHHIDDKNSRLQSENLRRQINGMEFSPDSTIHLFQMVTLLHENGDCSNHFLVMTTSHVILFEANLTWLIPPASNETDSSDGVSLTSTDLIVTSCHPLDDVTQIEAYSDTHLRLEFYQQRGSAWKPPWDLHLASPWVGCNLIQTLRPLWIDLLKVEFDVICYSEDLCIVKETLKETPFYVYIK